MNEIIVKSNKFEAAKQKLKTFSEQPTEDIKLKKVDTSKGLGNVLIDGFFKGEGFSSDHKVTGYELNELTGQIQNHFVRLNKLQIDLIKEFKEIYNALDALDKEYINGILTAIKAIEKTSIAIKTNQENIATNQEHIQELFDNQEATIEALLKFRDRVDTYEHLKDIDVMWETLQQYKETLDKLNEIKHIFDVDELWKKNSEYQKTIERQNASIAEMKSGFNLIEGKVKRISLIAGSAIGLSLIELVLLLLKVM